MILPELLAALEQVIQTRLVQHRGGIVELPAGADGVHRRVRGDERPEPVADAADGTGVSRHVAPFRPRPAEAGIGARAAETGAFRHVLR